MRDAVRFPSVVKTSVGTASRGIWFVRDESDLNIALYELDSGGGFADEVLVQDLDHRHHREGAIGVLPRRIDRLPRLSAGCRRHRRRRGDQARASAGRSSRGFIEQIGRQLDWHGALSVDYIMPLDSAMPLLIDCNPRLVEPFNAYRAGTDLVETPASCLAWRDAFGCCLKAAPGVRTHLAMQAAAGRRVARRHASRRHPGRLRN